MKRIGNTFFMGKIYVNVILIIQGVFLIFVNCTKLSILQ